MSDDRFNEYCEELLATYTRSNQQAVTRHLESLRNSLRSQGNHVVQTMFGGSVRRGTDVASLSDVDALLIVNDSSLVNLPPAEVTGYVRDVIHRQSFFGISRTVTTGKLAVTIKR